MGKGVRVYKLAEQLRNIIALELQRTADPRFILVTITSATVTPDLSQAKVYWIVGERERVAEVQAAFDAAAGFFRKAVSQALGTRSVPQLRFYYDDTLDTSAEIERLFERVEAQRAGTMPKDGTPGGLTKDKS